LGKADLMSFAQRVAEHRGEDPMTVGEKRVRTKFNPSEATNVDRIKQKTAELIDICESLRGLTHGPDMEESAEVQRLVSLAQTAYEEAAMWAVKAATA
jgi:hypothetical protein